jgi:hypothetical protein
MSILFVSEAKVYDVPLAYVAPLTVMLICPKEKLEIIPIRAKSIVPLIESSVIQLQYTLKISHGELVRENWEIRKGKSFCC